MKKQNESRPNINEILAGKELRRWYWLKDELIKHARSLGLKTSGGKFFILDRIAHFLDTKEKQKPANNEPRPTSRFDWHKETLTSDTIITDNYRNTQNVRRFFKEEAGNDFKFNIAFMDWMKENVGQTLGDACVVYRSLRKQETSPGFQTQIKEHNQFNQYTRDFLEDNPELGMVDVRKTWALKIQEPSETGRHVYNRSDLQL